jgi:cytochrome P450
MNNPLDYENVDFFMSLRNPNPKFKKLQKMGPVHQVVFELPEDEWQWFVDANTQGMVIECACRVTHSNKERIEPELPRVGGMMQDAED